MMEIWKDYIDCYEVSNMGNVRNKKTGKVLKPVSDYNKGYVRVDLNGKVFKVHRLVAMIFIPNPDNKPQVNHINGNKLDNRAENLEWCTNSENAMHAIKNGLWDKQMNKFQKRNEMNRKSIIARNIDTGEEKKFISISQAECLLGTKHITDVLKGKRSHAKGYTFRYVEGGDDDLHANN